MALYIETGEEEESDGYWSTHQISSAHASLSAQPRASATVACSPAVLSPKGRRALTDGKDARNHARWQKGTAEIRFDLHCDRHRLIFNRFSDLRTRGGERVWVVAS